jgi:hypothetical protein
LPSPPVPTAASITVRETLELLDGAFASLSSGVERGEYALWLGSGLSRDRVVGLNGVLHKLLEFLRVHVDAADAHCVYRRALDEVLAQANLSAVEATHTPYTEPSANWPDLAIILQRLAEKYSRVLDISVAGKVDDFLLWDVISFVDTFSTQETDAEHLCVGILTLEGAISEIASANWDGLLEAAAEELGYDELLYRVCVTGEDFRGPATAGKLLKFHGCALRAIADEARYRPLLIARWSQIVGWAVNDRFNVMKQELVSLAVRARTLMIGMSAQDPNIQQLFELARGRLAWNWTDEPPAHVFAEDRIGTDQKAILRISYGDQFNPNEPAILNRSCIRAYAKPLLVALVLKTISSKACGLLKKIAAPNLTPIDFEQLCNAIVHLRNLAAEAASADKLLFTRTLVRHLSRAKAMLQEGRCLTNPVLPYRPISLQPIHLALQDQNLASTGQCEAAGALALFGLAQQAGHWEIQIADPADPRSGAIRIISGTNTARVIFVAHTTEALRLFKDGVYSDDDDDVILVHSTEMILPQQRSPSRRLGRTGHRGVRHIEIAQLFQSANNIADLDLHFRREAAL